MDAEEQERLFREKTVRALQSHITELNAMEKVIAQAARKHTEVPNLKEIVKELADATAELRSVNILMRMRHCPARCGMSLVTR
jgi:hypothetical protein